MPRSLSIPVFVLALCAAMTCWLSFRYDKVQQGEVINSDGYGYYAYLQGWFVHGSTGFEFYPELTTAEQEKVWVAEGPTGQYLPKMSMGLAYAWAPGFLAADLLAGWLGYPQDGWSLPYQLAVLLSGCLFFLLGLYALWLWLTKWVSRAVASWTILLLVFATNLLQYAGPQASFSHLYSFSLLALCLWLSQRWLDRARLSHFMLLGFLFGWLVLIRPTNIIFTLIPIAMALSGGAGKLRSQVLNWKAVPALVTFIIPWIPQLLFWHSATGNWLHYSYGEEEIFWLQPHVIDGLFSYRNGWWIYTPIMVLLIPGMVLLWKTDRAWAAVHSLLISLHVYIVLSWWCWYYGDSLSIRPMIDAYALTALPLALVIRWVLAQKLLWWVPAMALAGLLIWNNLIQVDQYNRGLMRGSTMTEQAFDILFLNANAPGHLEMLGAYQVPDNDRLRLGLPERERRDTIVEKVLLEKSFVRTSEEESWNGTLDADAQYGPHYTVPASEFETPFDRSLRCMVSLKYAPTDNSEAYLVASFEEGAKLHGYYTISLHKLDLNPSEWNEVSMFLRRPEYLPDSGFVKVYLWVKSGPALQVKSLKLEQLDCPWSEPLQP